MKKGISVLIIAGLYILHQDFWFWRQARPLVFGALPIGLFYHVAFTVATSVVLAIFVKLLWPGFRIEVSQDDAEMGEDDRGGDHSARKSIFDLATVGGLDVITRATTGAMVFGLLPVVTMTIVSALLMVGVSALTSGARPGTATLAKYFTG
jgi:hypothetical protein